jgi:hypothetical protein
MPDAGASVFPALAEPVVGIATPASSVFFPGLHCLEHILVDSSGRQHVVLRASNAALQLTINGSSVVDGPVNLTLLVRGFSSLRAAVTHLSTLRRILSPTLAQTASPVWTATTRKLRDALVAYDGRAAGASYHDIALVLHDPTFVNRNWRTGLKERMRRHFSRGIALTTRGYGDLLSQI